MYNSGCQVWGSEIRDWELGWGRGLGPCLFLSPNEPPFVLAAVFPCWRASLTGSAVSAVPLLGGVDALLTKPPGSEPSHHRRRAVGSVAIQGFESGPHCACLPSSSAERRGRLWRVCKDPQDPETFTRNQIKHQRWNVQLRLGAQPTGIRSRCEGGRLTDSHAAG